jgi:hypothetical protein
VRTFGLVLLVVGIVGGLYCSDQMSKSEPVPPGLSVSESLRYASGRYEVGEYGCAAAGALGLILLLMPTGRT